jgi:hypothetical protein
MSSIPHSQRAVFMEAVKVALASLCASKLRSLFTRLAVMGAIQEMDVDIAH